MPFSLHDFAVLLTHEDLAAMPPALRAGFDAWQAQRALEPSSSMDERRVPPRTSLDEIAREMLRVLSGTMAAQDLGLWLDRFDGAPARQGAMVRNPLALVSLAVAGRHLDLLNVVLDRPGFCPGSPATMLRTLRQDERGTGAEAFNGSLHLATGHRDGLGSTVATMAFHALNEAFMDATPLLAMDDPLRGWCVARSVDEDRWSVAIQRLSVEPAGLEVDGHRQQGQTNLVGMAVLMGWAGAVQALLDHGVEPYATNGPRHGFTSPLVLAGHYQELECARTLMAHPSFDLARRFGRTDREAGNLAHASREGQRTLWSGVHRTAPVQAIGGPEVEFVLRQPALVRDAAVQDLLLDRLKRLGRAARTRVVDGLTDDGRRGLETVELHATARQVDGDGPGVRSARARL